MTQKNSVSAWGKPLLQNCQIELSHAVKNYGSDIQIIGKGVQEGYYVYIIFSNKDVINIYIYIKSLKFYILTMRISRNIGFLKIASTFNNSQKLIKNHNDSQSYQTTSTFLN